VQRIPGPFVANSSSPVASSGLGSSLRVKGFADLASAWMSPMLGAVNAGHVLLPKERPR
jgi:hypothetical protein